jgi:hypothetical protein
VRAHAKRRASLRKLNIEHKRGSKRAFASRRGHRTAKRPAPLPHDDADMDLGGGGLSTDSPMVSRNIRYTYSNGDIVRAALPPIRLWDPVY